MAGVFCEHGRVKTVCATCKPAPTAEPRGVTLPSGRAPSQETPRDEDEAPGPQAVRGPGKPLLPQRKRARRVTAEDAERAEAWWVRKG